MKKIILCIYIFIAILVPEAQNKDQTFGFGCLGLSGFFGGYGITQYDADGLNKHLSNFYSQLTSQNEIQFEQASGFRFGANIIRANFNNNVFFTAKGFYQFAKEEQSVNYSEVDKKDELTLSTNHWGLGIDFGFPLFTFLDIKLLEGGVKFYNVEYEMTNIENDEQVGSKYKSDETEIGYYVGTGLIINLVRGYISIEGTAMYSFYDVQNLISEDNYLVQNSVENPLIKNGGFGAALQLNVGFPL